MNISIPYNQLDIHVDGEMNFKNRSKKDD